VVGRSGAREITKIMKITKILRPHHRTRFPTVQIKFPQAGEYKEIT
jgi:hypothetical protein